MGIISRLGRAIEGHLWPAPAAAPKRPERANSLYRLSNRAEVEANAVNELISANLLHDYRLNDNGQVIMIGYKFLRHDEDLQYLRVFPELQELDLSVSDISNAGLALVAELRGLRWLNLQMTAISDDGLSHIAGLKNLEFLRLSDTHITDAGMPRLSGLTRMRKLSFLNDRISDAGLVHLYGMSDLREINLMQTLVTPAGVAELMGRLKKLEKPELEAR